MTICAITCSKAAATVCCRWQRHRKQGLAMMLCLPNRMALSSSVSRARCSFCSRMFTLSAALTHCVVAGNIAQQDTLCAFRTELDQMRRTQAVCSVREQAAQWVTGITFQTYVPGSSSFTRTLKEVPVRKTHGKHSGDHRSSAWTQFTL